MMPKLVRFVLAASRIRSLTMAAISRSAERWKARWLPDRYCPWVFTRGTLPQSLAGLAQCGWGFIASVAPAGRSAPPDPTSGQDQRQSLPTNPALSAPPEGVPSCSQGKTL